MPISPRISGFLLLALLAAACNNEQDTRKHIEANQAILIKKQNDLSDLKYNVTRNSLRVGTNDYDTSMGKNFETLSAAIQASIDSLKAQTDSLEALISK